MGTTMKLGPKRRQLLEGLNMTTNGGWPLSWLKLSFQHLASRMQAEGLVRIVGPGEPCVYLTAKGRKAVRK